MIEKEELYPILFRPVYKRVMWGGHNLETLLHRTIPEDASSDPVGEAWEICDRPGVSSVVENGPLTGMTLRELITSFGRNLLGSRSPLGAFPLLVKIIDAGKRLSLQVHPDEIACRKLGNGAQPKTEMWYILHAARGAKIFAGLRPDTTRMRFLSGLAGGDCENSLHVFDSEPGDSYFIPAGRVHAIGSGNLLLEIQQNSDTTYRISDWGRVGSDGKPRALHLEQANQCIDYNDRTVSRITGVSNAADHNRKYPIVQTCPFFRVEDLRLISVWSDSTEGSGSFHLLTAVNGSVRVGRPGAMTEIPAGRTCLVPACFGAYEIDVPVGKTVTVVKTTL